MKRIDHIQERQQAALRRRLIQRIQQQNPYAGPIPEVNDEKSDG